MRLVKMILEFLNKYALLEKTDRDAINNIRKDVSRKQIFKREEGFLPIPSEEAEISNFVYEPSKDTRLNKLRQTGPYFRIWFYKKTNGDIYFTEFEKLN